MATLSMLCVNMNGLNDDKKRDKFITHMRKLKYDIICVQETHIIGKNVENVEKQWQFSHPDGGNLFWNPGPSSKSGGTGILLGNNHIKALSLQKDANGRILCLKLKFESEEFQVMNIYGPNAPGDREFFFDT